MRPRRIAAGVLCLGVLAGCAAQADTDTTPTVTVVDVEIVEGYFVPCVVSDAGGVACHFDRRVSP